MSLIQPTFDGNQLDAPAPSGTPHLDDYDAWVSLVRPTFVAVARAGRPFVCWQIAKTHQLPEPPDQKRDWARLMGSLHRDGLIRCDGFALARDKSAVRRWRGTRAARDGRVS